jgi:ectoine hydroxylase-related dioxygenase (phytanoyl-CoA dioxygenase family)
MSNRTPLEHAPLSAAQQRDYERQGFVVLEAFADATVCDAMLARVRAIAAAHAAGEDTGDVLVLPEQQPDFARIEDGARRPVISKIFRVARDPVFHDFAVNERVTALVEQLLATDDCDTFLSQFIFKNPGAWGQPWHQDSYYFPFDPPRPIVGFWLAVTAATLENGCLHVMPGSQAEPVLEHRPDSRAGANYGYTEIVGHDTTTSVPVLMQPSDLLVFDSHLMHRSTDNVSADIRAAMVFHLARAGTVDHTEEIRGYTVNDWLPVRRADAAAT